MVCMCMLPGFVGIQALFLAFESVAVGHSSPSEHLVMLLCSEPPAPELLTAEEKELVRFA